MTARNLTLALLLAVGLLAAPSDARAQAPRWTLQPDDSRVGFVARQSGSEVAGRFTEWRAEIHFDSENLAESRVMVEIEMASVDSGARDRDEALRGNGLFDVARFAEGRFEAESFSRTGPQDFAAEGRLTLRDVTRQVSLPFTLTIEGEGAGAVARAAGELTIDRLDFGVGQGQWADTSMIPAEVVIRFEITAVAAPD